VWPGTIFGYFQRHSTLDMQIALRECDFDTIGVETVPNRHQNSVLDIINSIFRIIYPNPQFQIDSTVTISPDKTFGFRDFLNTSDAVGSVRSQGFGLVQIRLIGDTEGYGKAQVGIFERKIFYFLRHKDFIGYVQ